LFIDVYSAASVDPDFFSVHPGIAIAVRSSSGEKVAAVAAYLERPGEAVIYERWLLGPRRFWQPAISALFMELKGRNVRVVRAGAGDVELRKWYEENIGMTVWRELVRYERGIGVTPPRGYAVSGPAVIRPVELERDRAALDRIWAEEPSHPPIAALEALAGLHPFRFMVAEMAGSLCGYCFSYLEGASVCLKSVIVDRAKRGRGIGRQLVADAVHWFDELKVPSFLNTEADNPVTHELYTSFGYQRVGAFCVLECSL
jgi:GNAT superfamily N-acetyltransferase